MSRQPATKPMGRNRGFAPGGSLKNMDSKTLRRLLSYLGEYKLRLIFVVICILVSSAASVASIAPSHAG